MSLLPYATDTLTAHFISCSPTFAEWLDAKRRYGQDPAVESRFQSSHAFQHKSLAPSFDDRDRLFKRNVAARFRDGFAAAMTAVDQQSNYAFSPPKTNITSFVDLGCAPGGFSKWLLSKHDKATGIGISLPESDHGLPIDLTDWSDDEKRRYSVHRTNITAIPQSQAVFNSVFSNNSMVDLIICGAVWRDEHTTLGWNWRSKDILSPANLSTERPQTDKSSRDRLTLSQLLIALRVLKQGGAMLIVASLKLTFSTIDTLVFLRDSFERITPTKAKLHQTRSSYYLVCEGFKLCESERQECVRRVEEMIRKLSPGVHGREHLNVSLTGFTDPLQLAQRETSFVLSHLESLWVKQISALQTELEAAQSYQRKQEGHKTRLNFWKRKQFNFHNFANT